MMVEVSFMAMRMRAGKFVEWVGEENPSLCRAAFILSALDVEPW